MSTLNRRDFLLRAAGLAGLPFLGATSKLFAEDKPGAPPPVERKNLITAEQLAATKKGLDWLQKHQAPQGSFGSGVQVAVTALAGCAFMAEGHLPGRGKHGVAIQKALDYILKCSKNSRRGYITEMGGEQSRMHGHGFAAMFLGEAYGMMSVNRSEDAEKMKTAIKKAIDVIEKSQTNLGGWGYQPEPTYDEGSVTVAEVMALRSCRNAGFKVEKKTIDKGMEYLKKSANPDGSFKYSLQGGGGGGTFPLTAGAVASMQMFGLYDAPQVKKGLEFLKKSRVQRQGGWGHYYYGNLYATMAAYFTGGQTWEEWFPQVRDEFIKAQTADGAWSGEYDQAYATSFAVLTLAIPYQYLPIFQA